MSDLQKNVLEQNQDEALRAWEEFGRPLAGSTIGHPPQAQEAANDKYDLPFYKKEEIQNRTNRVA